MNDVATTNGNAVGVNQQTNFFNEYGEQASAKSIVGTLLKFSKGDYLFGSNDEDMPVGTKMIADMDQLKVGWMRWENSKPTDTKMGAVTAGFQPVKRNTLGDDDESLWERDNTGKAKDPWAFTNNIVLQQVDVEGDAGQFTFTTTSRGGINAIGDLCKIYGKNMRARPNEWPVITLGVDSYVHADYGRVKVPEFEVVGWTAKDADAGEGNDPQRSDPQPADSSGRTPRGQGGHAASGTATKF